MTHKTCDAGIQLNTKILHELNTKASLLHFIGADNSYIIMTSPVSVVKRNWVVAGDFTASMILWKLPVTVTTER